MFFSNITFNKNGNWYTKKSKVGYVVENLPYGVQHTFKVIKCGKCTKFLVLSKKSVQDAMCIYERT